ncbi:MAG TPA: DUF4276 family protein [Chloroflexota bacterium]|nr:DUF4276 family protein [Chloroflexota bacterium]
MNAVPRIVSIVEGDGELAAVPILIRRVGAELGLYVDCFRSILTSRDRFPRFPQERENRMRIARIDAGESGAILVLLDADGEPPCSHGQLRCLLGTDLIEAVTPLAAGLPIAVVLAQHEFETWFIAAAPSLVASGDLVPGTEAPEDPERIRGAKEWLSIRMFNRPSYSPTADQARLTERFDMQMARQRSPSFDRCYREIERLILSLSVPQTASQGPG